MPQGLLSHWAPRRDQKKRRKGNSFNLQIHPSSRRAQLAAISNLQASYSTGLGKNSMPQVAGILMQVEAEVVSNSWNKIHQTCDQNLSPPVLLHLLRIGLPIGAVGFFGTGDQKAVLEEDFGL